MKGILSALFLLLWVGLAGCSSQDPAPPSPRLDQSLSSFTGATDGRDPSSSFSEMIDNPVEGSASSTENTEKEINYDPPKFALEGIYFTRQNGTLYYYNTSDYVNHPLLENASEHGFIAADRLLVIVDDHRLISTNYDGSDQACIYSTSRSISNLYTDRYGAFFVLDRQIVVRLDLKTKEIDSYKVEGPLINFIVPISNFRVRVHPYSEVYVKNPPSEKTLLLDESYFGRPFAIDFRDSKG